MSPAPQAHPPEEGTAINGVRSMFFFIWLFVILTAGIVASGTYYYRYQVRKFRDEAERQLMAIAELKGSELEQWRKDCLSDGGILFKNVAFSGLVRRFLEQPEDQDAQQQCQSWLDAYAGHFRYQQIRLLDTHGVTRLSSPAGAPTVSSMVAEQALEALLVDRVTLQDFYRGDDGVIRLAVLVPIFDEADGRRPLGVIVMWIDPYAYLYPFINRWPVPSATAETLLVRREGNEVVFLNELRFQKNTALTLHYPLTTVTLPAVRAALGEEGIMEGIDYRGVPVMAAQRSIPDSPWSLVARQDIGEVVTPLHALLWRVIAMIAALILALAAGVGLIWRQQKVRFYRSQAATTARLRASEKRYRFALEVTGQIGWSTPPDGVVDDMPMWRQYSGQSPEEVVGWKWLDAIHPDDRQSAYNAWSSAAAQKCDYFTEYRIRRADGVYRDFMVRGIPLLDSDGSCKEWVGTCIDITERKQTESELQQKTAELERFLYAASHDLKSPVVTINAYLGYLELDMASGDAGRIEKDMRFIHAATGKMALLLDNMLEIARVGHLVSQPVRVTFRDLVEEALAAVAGRIAGREVAVEVGAQDVTLIGERIRLAEIWQNLIDNACKFMGAQAAPCIEVGMETRGAETVFFVRDNGIGLDPRYHAKVFNLFEKLDPRAEGTGLGLALIKRIIELYRGRIWIESHGEGQGCCFYFTLPAALQNEAPMKRP